MLLTSTEQSEAAANVSLTIELSASLSHMDIFLDTEATNKAVIQAGTAIFQYLYHGPNLTLGEIRYKMFSRKAVAEMVKPETLPPTEGAVVQHSLRAYL